MTKIAARLRRSRKARARIKQKGAIRLAVHRSAKNIYAQIIEFRQNQSFVLACASTLESELESELGGSKTKVEQAKIIGIKIAERAKEKGIEKVAFDRSGYLYHGRVKALAEGAREGGLDF